MLGRDRGFNRGLNRGGNGYGPGGDGVPLGFDDEGLSWSEMERQKEMRENEEYGASVARGMNREMERHNRQAVSEMKRAVREGGRDFGESVSMAVASRLPEIEDAAVAGVKRTVLARANDEIMASTDLRALLTVGVGSFIGGLAVGFLVGRAMR